MYHPLREAFDRIFPIAEPDWQRFESILQRVTVPKNEYLLEEGQVCRGVYFLEEGLVRTYYLNDGREVNLAFNFEREFLREIESLANGTPSRKFMQALEDSQLTFIEKARLTELYQSSSVFPELGRRILEQLTITEQQYASLLAAHSPQERYLRILQDKPEMIQRVPLQHLASYLGISRESLSRIRKRVS